MNIPTNTCYLYILCSRHNRHLTICTTADLRHGVRQHRRRISQRLGRKKVFQKVVLIESFPGRCDAVARKKELIGFSRARLMGLIARRNPTWKNLSVRRYLDAVA